MNKHCWPLLIAAAIIYSSASSGQEIQLSSSILWTENHDIDLSPSIAYCAFQNGLMTFDIQFHPDSPQYLGKLDFQGTCRGMEQEGSYAYMAVEGLGLAVIDVSNPFFPVLRSSCPTAGNCNDVALSGNYAFVLADSFLQVIDIADPASPYPVGDSVLIHSYFPPPRLFVFNDLLYIPLSSEMLIFDISDPTAPALVANLVVESHQPDAVYALDSLAYVAAQIDFGLGTLDIYDISNPSSPSFVGSCFVDGDPFDVAVVEEYAYLATGMWGIVKVDIHDPSHPAQIDSYFSNQMSYGIAISGNHAYLANAHRFSLQAFDCTWLSLTGQYDSHSMTVEDVVVKADYALAATGRPGLQVIDVRNPYDPVIVGTYEDPYYIYSVNAEGDYAYIGSFYGVGRFETVSMVDPAHPTLVGSCAISDIADHVFIANGYAYLAAGYSGMQIIDISNPSNPTVAGSFDPSPWVLHIFVVGSYAYAAAGGLLVIDVSDPANPHQVAELPLSGANGIWVVGAYAYIASTVDGLVIIDIANPLAPVEVASYPAYGIDVKVSGSYAYLAGSYTGVSIFDVSDPANPAFLARYETPGFSSRLDVVGNRIFVGDTYSFMSMIYPPDICNVVPGDANGDRILNGIDIVYMINWLKGIGPAPPGICLCRSVGELYVAADWNGSCVFNGIDVTYAVSYFKGSGAEPLRCPLCPPGE
jgi:hypothetical protein